MPRPSSTLLALCLSLSLSLESIAQQETLGRLFLTPERRAALDRVRQQNPANQHEAISENARLTVNGIVRRSSGRNTAWVNGNTLNETSPAGELDFRKSAGRDDQVFVSTGSTRQALRVGDSLNRDSGAKEEILPGRLRIRRENEK